MKRSIPKISGCPTTSCWILKYESQHAFWAILTHKHLHIGIHITYVTVYRVNRLKAKRAQMFDSWFDKMTNSARTDDSAFKWVLQKFCNSYVHLIYYYTIVSQSQVDKWVQMLTYIRMNNVITLEWLKKHSCSTCTPKFHAKAENSRSMRAEVQVTPSWQSSMS